ncbi:MAG TPA: FtsQ-type POTRA domain-containing protein [bacterium]|nr:FtsQ-type POTRA domain-containing protein [bacterium]
MSIRDENFKPRRRVNYDAVLHVTTPKKGGAWRFWLLISVLLLMLFGVVYLLFFSDYFKIKIINIDGAGEEMQNEIKEMLSWETEYMILFNNNAFRDEINNKWNDFAVVEVQKQYPNTISVTLVPEVPKVIWHSGNKLFLVNDKGMVLGGIEEPERLAKYNNLPVVDDLSGLSFEKGDRVVGGDFVTFLDSVKNGIENSVRKQIEAFVVAETTFELRVKMKDGYVIYFDALRDPQTQVEKLNLFLKDGKVLFNEYIDLRVPGKVYYK